MNAASLDPTLVAYLLSELSDETREGVEAEVFASDDQLSDLLALEEALLEALLDDVLDPGLRRRVEDALTRTPHLRRERDRIASLRRAAAARAAGAALAVGLAARVLRLRLRPGLERGGEGPATVALGDVDVLVLELPAADGLVGSALVRIEAEDGRHLLEVPATGAAGAVTATIPAASLEPGLLHVLLLQDEGGVTSPVDDFFVRVLP